MLEAFQELGDAITRAWRDKNYDEAVFADIASSALIESQVLRATTPPDIVHWLVTSPRIPQQSYRDFGQPPITLYLGHNLIIEALYWLDGTTAIHEHSFSGAFGVLAGSSVHSRYHFEMKERVSSRMMLGELQFISCELLNHGEVRAIRAGNEFIHSLFHLDRPSISVVVRTIKEIEYGPQYSYQKPGVALDSFYKPEPFLTQLRVLGALRKTDVALYWGTAQTIISTCDLWMALMVLRLAHREPTDSQPRQNLVRLAQERHGDRIKYLLEALMEQDREMKIIALRESVHEAEYRFFLALLLNGLARDAIYNLILKRYPNEEPDALVLRWIKGLVERKLIALDLNPTSLIMLRHILRETSLDNTKVAMAGTSSLVIDKESESRIIALRNEIRSNLLLRPLVL
jgi:hypothetical protein